MKRGRWISFLWAVLAQNAPETGARSDEGGGEER